MLEPASYVAWKNGNQLSIGEKKFYTRSRNYAISSILSNSFVEKEETLTWEIIRENSYSIKLMINSVNFTKFLWKSVNTCFNSRDNNFPWNYFISKSQFQTNISQLLVDFEFSNYYGGQYMSSIAPHKSLIIQS